jgi:hypothetical protein
MAAPSVTYTFSNSTTADATEVNQNFTDVINGITDGTKDLTINLLTVNGAASFNGNVTLGNATGDDVTVTGRVASDVIPKTAANNTLGNATLTWQSLYLDNTTTDGGAIYFDGSSTKFIKSDASGANLNLGGFTGLDLTAGCSIKTYGRYLEAKSADYTITDTDGVSTVLVTTGSSTITVTLPTAADNTGRVITVKKVDSGTGKITLDGEGSETIDGYTSTNIGTYSDSGLTGQYAFMTVQCDGTGWHVIDFGGDILRANSSTGWSTSTFNANSIAVPAGLWRFYASNFLGANSTDRSLTSNFTTTSTGVGVVANGTRFLAGAWFPTAGIGQICFSYETRVTTNTTTWYNTAQTSSVSGASSGSHIFTATRIG